MSYFRRKILFRSPRSAFGDLITTIFTCSASSLKIFRAQKKTPSFYPGYTPIYEGWRLWVRLYSVFPQKAAQYPSFFRFHSGIARACS